MFAKCLNTVKNENVLLDPNSEALCPPLCNTVIIWRDPPPYLRLRNMCTTPNGEELFRIEKIAITCGLKKPVIQKTLGLPWKHHLLNWPSLSNSSVYQNPRVVERQEIFFQVSGTRASNMLSRVAFKSSLITIVPSRAIFRSSRVRLGEKECHEKWHNTRSLDLYLTRVRIFCILSISCLKKMFIGNIPPSLTKASFTSWGM